jgi:adenosylcobinamide kinase/adenosylcobinamide-phosphate guanylyltransferase
VAFIATAQAGDPEMAMRISAHKQERPPHWITHEIPQEVAATWRSHELVADLVILDCLTFLVSNLVLQAAQDLDAPNEKQAAMLVAEEIDALVALVQETIVIGLWSNEVGKGWCRLTRWGACTAIGWVGLTNA